MDLRRLGQPQSNFLPAPCLIRTWAIAVEAAPRFCRAAAYELFAAQLPTLEEIDSLVRAAVAVAMHERDDTDLAEVEKTLADIAVASRRAVEFRSHFL